MVPQVFKLFFGQLKHEFFWESIKVPFYRTNNLFYVHPIQLRQISVQQHLRAAKQQDRAFDPLKRNVGPLAYRQVLARAHTRRHHAPGMEGLDQLDGARPMAAKSYAVALEYLRRPSRDKMRMRLPDTVSKPSRSMRVKPREITSRTVPTCAAISDWVKGSTA